MIKTLQATTFEKALTSGRTCPFLMLCADDDGKQTEIVVKLYSGKESSPKGLICELMAALFARDLDLPVPEPFLVAVEPNFYQCISEPEQAARFQKSAGLNFGSKYLGPGYITWPRERSISGDLIQDAAEIFAFDIMIQNPDRRKDKPNVLRKGDNLAIFDHEMAFSFLYAFTPNEYPWEGKGLGFAQDHVFHAGLRKCSISWDRIQGALEAIDERRIHMYVAAIPDDWRHDNSDTPERIGEYIMKAHDNSKKLFLRIMEALI